MNALNLKILLVTISFGGFFLTSATSVQAMNEDELRAAAGHLVRVLCDPLFPARCMFAGADAAERRGQELAVVYEDWIAFWGAHAPAGIAAPIDPRVENQLNTLSANVAHMRASAECMILQQARNEGAEPRHKRRRTR